jgi:hypothetical protein
VYLDSVLLVFLMTDFRVPLLGCAFGNDALNAAQKERFPGLHHPRINRPTDSNEKYITRSMVVLHSSEQKSEPAKSKVSRALNSAALAALLFSSSSSSVSVSPRPFLIPSPMLQSQRS